MALVDATHSYANSPETRSETFCTYLARQLIAKKGFEVASIPEVQELNAVSDIVLTQSDGFTLTILCMIDRETRPDRVFGLDVDKVRRIGKACMTYHAKTTVFIRVMEIGPGAPGQQHRLKQLKRPSLTSKVIPSGMIVDTASGEVWNSDKTWLSKGAYHDFVESLLTSPREDDAGLTPPVIAVARQSFPILTFAILILLAAVFAAEIVYGIGPWTKALQPTITTLLAFGGLMRNLVLQSGEWYRLFSAPFLHVDAGHLAMNGVCLFLAGRVFEPLVGRAWFGAVYVVGALSGALLSLALNPATLVSVGASGAIMGLFAAMLVVSTHFPPGVLRTRLQKDAVYVLIPSLLPLTSVLKGVRVDYAAHFGGAIGGVVVGLVMLRVWSRTEILPAFRKVAAAVSVVGVAALAYPITSVARQYHAAAFAQDLIPRESYPSEAGGISQSSYYVKRYPRDPRSHMFRALALLTAQDLAGAESEARRGLLEEDIWSSFLPKEVSLSLRTTLAIVIVGDRPEEAKALVRPVCNTTAGGNMRKILDSSKLCSP
jgi:rhomboid protease GluP